MNAGFAGPEWVETRLEELPWHWKVSIPLREKR